MCGICGIINTDREKSIDKDILRKMNNSLSHRGPDEEGYLLKGNVGLGMRRLSIIDVKGGHQPIYNEEKTVCIVCNGEIYNYVELRKDLEKRGHNFYTHSDVEVIVHLYEEDPDNFENRLRGMFAIAIYDLNKEKLILARDRLGIKPLYYTYQNGIFLFASELKAILKYPDLKKELSFEALSDYLTFLYIPAPETIFKCIYKLPPAHKLVLSKKEVSLKQYWEVNYKKEKEEDEQYYAEKFKGLLKESVRMHLMSEVPLGAFLSGGMDSSTIVALMAQIMDKPVKTFSVGFDVLGFNELNYAKLVSKRFNTEHSEINLSCDIVNILPKLVRQLDEPFADSSAIPTYLISEFAKRKVTVCLSGDGGDELFAGYDWTRRQKFIKDFNFIPEILKKVLKSALHDKNYTPDRKNTVIRKLKRFVYDANAPLEYSFMRRITCFSEEMKKGLFKESIYNELRNYKSLFKILPFITNLEIDNDLEKLLFVDTKLFLPDDGLCKVDRMSMAHSLEVRVPLLDHKLVEFVASMPIKFKMRGLVSKYIFKKSMQDLLPRAITKQRKLGFTMPVNNWFRHRLKDYACDLLLSENSSLKQFFNIEVIERLIKEHIEGRQSFGYQIYALIVFEQWLRENNYESSFS